MHVTSAEEVVRSMIDTANRCLQSGDLGPWLDGYIDSEFVWDTLETGRVTGRDGASQVANEWLDAFAALQITINDVIPLGAERVLVEQSITGQLKGTHQAKAWRTTSRSSTQRATRSWLPVVNTRRGTKQPPLPV